MNKTACEDEPSRAELRVFYYRGAQTLINGCLSGGNLLWAESQHVTLLFCGGRGADLFSNCTDECKALGHSDRCWMPSFVPGDGRQGGDYRSNLHVPGMDAVPDTEVQAGVAPGMLGDDHSFSTFGKDKSHHGTLTPHDLLLPSARAPYKPSYLSRKRIS
ncbi:hypothetical protein SRHO_G00246930 [Serrasalmus rhombeus]